MESIGCLAKKMINIDRIARIVFETRKQRPRRGRLPKIYKQSWEELDEGAKQEIKDEVQDVIEALISEGFQFHEVIRRRDSFKSAKKKDGVFVT